MFISTVEINDVTGKVSPAEQSTCLQPSEEQMIDEMSTVHFQTPVGKTDRPSEAPKTDCVCAPHHLIGKLQFVHPSYKENKFCVYYFYFYSG